MGLRIKFWTSAREHSPDISFKTGKTNSWYKCNFQTGLANTLCLRVKVEIGCRYEEHFSVQC